jgi:CRP-like cAMP-binding protein
VVAGRRGGNVHCAAIFSSPGQEIFQADRNVAPCLSGAILSNSAVFANARKVEQLHAGDVLFHEGDVGEEMYGVISGTLELSSGGTPVTRVTEGGVFGELALVDKEPRSLTATAATDASVAVIDRRMFLFLIHETPTFALDVMGSMAARLRAQTAVVPR